MTGFAELGALSNFTFLEGASHPQELVEAARALGHAAIGIADRNSFAGLVRGHVAAAQAGLPFVPGVRIRLADGVEYLAWPTDRAAYGRLARLLSEGRMHVEKGQCRITRDALIAAAEGQVMALLPPPVPWFDQRDHAAVPTEARSVDQAWPRATSQRRAASSTDAGTAAGSPRSGGNVIALPSRAPTRQRPDDQAPLQPDERAEPRLLADAHARHDDPRAHTSHAETPPHLRRAEPPAHLQRDATARSPQDLAARVRQDFSARLRQDADALNHRLALPLFVAAQHRHDGADRKRLDALAQCGAPLLAAGGTRFHAAPRRRLADLVAAIRLGVTIDTLGYAAHANAEAHLKPEAEMRRLFGPHAQAIDNTLRVVEACRFSMADLAYEYPEEILDPGLSPQQTLERRVAAAVDHRWPDGVPEKVAAQIAHELRLIGQLDYAPYFLTVHEIVRYAESVNILCQGRGSAANSAVCYALGITAVPPDKHDLLFERFISASRNEPPDIDVDFEHERREEVIQHIYTRYGRDRAAIAATVIRYRERSAIREVGRAMGLSEDITARLAKSVWNAGDKNFAGLAAEQGLDPAGDRRLALACELADELTGFPRHLATHVGGFVITKGPLTELAVVTKAAMKDRHTIEWDKDDIEALRIMKVDVLGLGMLTCIRRAFDLIAQHGGPRLTLASVPQDDPATYAMLRRADSLGVFQVESRAQMNMLPRLRPEKFYDLVIEVAIVRPGPIQGDMVHPYLRRKNGEEPVTYPSEALKRVLEKTLGVPLFQEQAMQIAIVGAGFSPERADQLRRAMATFRHVGTIGLFKIEFLEGMAKNGYTAEFAERCFSQIEGFGTYGFPESHAASFALLVYVSSWLKCHHPAAFAAALLNSQPMGFYAPAQIVRDAREHGVDIRPVDVTVSHCDCTLENNGKALRLGLRLVQGLDKEKAKKVGGLTPPKPPAFFHSLAQSDNAHFEAPPPNGTTRAGNEQKKVDGGSRGEGVLSFPPGQRLQYLIRAAGLTREDVAALAEADAFRGLGLDRRAALWEAAAIEAAQPLQPDLLEQAALLPTATDGEQTVLDYGATGLTLRHHPLTLLRPQLDKAGLADTRRLNAAKRGTWLKLPGLVLVRQRPGSAKGVVFFTVEDEHGVANLVLYPDLALKFRAAVVAARLVVAHGRVERHEAAIPIIHLIVHRLEDHTHLLNGLSALEAPWRRALARADEVERPGNDARGPGARSRPDTADPNARPTGQRPGPNQDDHPLFGPRCHPPERAPRLPPSRDFH